MGNIPLPALDVRPPQQQDPLAGVEKLVQLKSLMQGQQLQQGEIQQQQQQLADNHALTTAMKNWDPKSQSYDDLTQSVLKNGGSGNAALQIKQHALQVQKTVSDIAAQDATTGSKNLETFINTHKTIGSMLEGMENVPDDQLQAKAISTVNDMVSGKVIQPQVAQQMLQGIQQTQDPKVLRQSIVTFAKSSMGALTMAEQAKTQSETNLNAAKQANEESQKAKTDMEMQYYKEHGGAPGVPTEQVQMSDWLSKNPGKTPADFMKYKATLVPQFNFNMNALGGGLGPNGAGANGAAGGANAPASINQVPAAIRGRVQAALDYRQALPPQGRNNPVNNAVSEWVYKLDPQHDETNFPARNKLMTAFTSGKESQQINAVNTAMGHVGVLGDAIDALHNGDVKVLNSIANKFGVQVGQTPTTTFNTIVHRVGPELAAAYIQGGGGEGERGTTQKDFDSSLGPNALKSNVAVTARLLRSKIGALENQYKNTMGRDDFQQRFITPEAQASLNKWSPQQSTGGKPSGPPAGATMKVPGSDGKLHWSDGKKDLGIAE